jgi:hypothetical protein
MSENHTNVSNFKKIIKLWHLHGFRVRFKFLKTVKSVRLWNEECLSACAYQIIRKSTNNWTEGAD